MYNWHSCTKRSFHDTRKDYRSKHLLQRLMWLIALLIMWLAPWADKMNQIQHCDWLPERARGSYLARSGLPATSRKKNFPESRIINPLLTKLVRSRWLDIRLHLFLRVYGPQKKNLANIQPSWSHTWSTTHMYRPSGTVQYLCLLMCKTMHGYSCQPPDGMVRELQSLVRLWYPHSEVVPSRERKKTKQNRKILSVVQLLLSTF